jgi:hypothetical protein
MSVTGDIHDHCKLTCRNRNKRQNKIIRGACELSHPSIELNFGALFIYLFISFVQLRLRLACEVQLITREG